MWAGASWAAGWSHVPGGPPKEVQVKEQAYRTKAD